MSSLTAVLLGPPGVDALSPSARRALYDIAEASTLLSVAQITPGSLSLALCDAVEEGEEAEQTAAGAAERAFTLRAETEEAGNEVGALQRQLEEEEEDPDSRQGIEENTEYLVAKAGEYQARVAALAESLDGLEEMYMHDNLLALSASLAETMQRVHHVSAQVATYAGLPPDIAMARTRLDRSRAQLSALESRITSLIASIRPAPE